MDFIRRIFVLLGLGKRGACMAWAPLLLVLTTFWPHAAHAQIYLPNEAAAWAACQAYLAPWDPRYQPTCTNRDPTGTDTSGSAVFFSSNIPTGLAFNYPYISPNPAKNLGPAENGGGGNGGDCKCGSGSNGGAPTVGDPINASTGNKYRQDDDYTGNAWLTFRRFYNSSSVVSSSAMGTQWRHSFDRSLTFPTIPIISIVMLRPDGQQEFFTKTNGVWTNDLPLVDSLTETVDAQGVTTGYTVHLEATGQTETYDTTGKLLTVTDDKGQGIALTYSDATTPASLAPQAGLLLTVTDSWSRQLAFAYDSANHLHQVTLPDGGKLTYAYDSATGNLLSVQYPDTTARQYVYNESALTGGTSLPSALTGVVDEAGVRYENTTYDGAGRATSSGFAGNTNTTQISYDTYSRSQYSTVQYPLGQTAVTTFTTANGLDRIGAVDQPCGPGCGLLWKTRTYDANGYPASATDFNGNTTTTQYNPYGLLQVQVDAANTPDQRTTTTQWNTGFGKPVTRQIQDAQSHLLASSGWSYNALGEVNARCEMDPAVPAAASSTCATTGTVPAGVRRWTYTYCNAVDTTQCPLIGLLLTSTGPRADLPQSTTYSYYTTSSATNCGTPGAACYQPGDLYQITDALGHVTTIASYDGAGRVTRVTDGNGVTTDSTYNVRGWLVTRTVGGAATTLTYTPYGAVQTVTDPDGVALTYGYDPAHRLTAITDTAGNTIHYTLDAAGHQIAETVRDSQGTVTRSLARTFNPLGQLTAITDGLNQTVFNASYSDSYDANGNPVHSADALGTAQQQGYDALNRLISTLQNYNGTDTATKNTSTTTTLDALDRVTAVTDPSNLTTNYTYDGLGNRTQLSSPDTGTSTDTFDAAGNRLVHTDAKGIASTSSYDALDRLISTSYADTTANVSYTYDEANTVTGCASSAPIGRLTRVIEASVTTAYCYDAHGNVVQKSQTAAGHIDVTHYAFSAADRLNTITAPDGTLTTYAHDSDGRVSHITVQPSGATAASTVASAITWRPFGPVTSYTLGNGQTVTRTFDANDRITDVTSPALALHFARDAMGNITAIGNAPGANPATETYHYDPLYRITDATEANGIALESYTYNSTGDRLSKTAPGLATGAYLYTSGTHQLSSIGNAARANDANGNTTGSVIGGGTYGFAYDSRSRLNLVQANGATVAVYTYNALGQRIGKGPSASQAMAERYAYDENSGLIGEYGATNRDYIWLGGIPVAVIDNAISGSATTSTINYVHADGLGTPRAVTNGAGATIWQWAYQGNPFGEQPPTSATGYVLNLRFPGQYFDAEIGTNYNVNRNYEPPTGRYLQPDPTGFDGGISLYAYAFNNPLMYIDPMGLCPSDNEPTGEKKIDSGPKWCPAPFPPGAPLKPKPGYEKNPSEGCRQSYLEKAAACEMKCFSPSIIAMCEESWRIKVDQCAVEASGG